MVAAIVCLVFVRLFVLEPLIVRESSMEPTLLGGDHLLVNRLVAGTRIPQTRFRLRGYGAPAREQVWVLGGRGSTPGRMVKRVIGIPGDTLEMRDRQLYVNGYRVEEPYARWRGKSTEATDRFAWQTDYLVGGQDKPGYTASAVTWGPLVVPNGFYFVMGDNRNASIDSRHWGMVARNRMHGRVVVIYFSRGFDVGEELSGYVRVRWERVGARIR